MTNDERKERIKTLLKEITSLPEEEQITEFASMVYAKCAITHLTECFKKHFESPEKLRDAAQKMPFLDEVVGIVATYGTMGMEMGFASLKEDKDVSK